jgi:hypothetical protein
MYGHCVNKGKAAAVKAMTPKQLEEYVRIHIGSKDIDGHGFGSEPIQKGRTIVLRDFGTSTGIRVCIFRRDKATSRVYVIYETTEGETKTFNFPDKD